MDAPLQYKYPWKSTTQKKIDLMLNWFVKSQDYVICGYLLGAPKLVDLIYNNKRQQKKSGRINTFIVFQKHKMEGENKTFTAGKH